MYVVAGLLCFMQGCAFVEVPHHYLPWAVQELSCSGLPRIRATHPVISAQKCLGHCVP